MGLGMTRSSSSLHGDDAPAHRPGVRSPWAGMRLGSLKNRYPEEHYALLLARLDGELFEQPEVFEEQA